MKILSTFLLVLTAAICVAQADITPSVSAALKKGDAATLAGMMMPQIELTINGQDGNLSKADAQKSLTTFFRDYTVTNFTVKHQGTSKLDDQYRIGEMATNKGNFRVTFFIKKSGTTMQIRQLKIEASDE